MASDALDLSALKVAVVHDWMFSRRGGEKVLEALLDLFPQSDLFVLFGKPEEVLKTHNTHTIHKSFLSVLPGLDKWYKYFLPLFPMAAESFNLQGYDLVISSSSCAAKGVIVSPLAVHVSYIHSPMRYVWDQEHVYFPKPVSWNNPLEIFRRWLLNRCRIWDVTSAARIDTIVANSQFVARRIALYWGKTAAVVHPSVDLKQFQPAVQSATSQKVLLFGAWVPYKKMYESAVLLLQHGIAVVAAGHGDALDKLEAEQGKWKGLLEVRNRPSDAEIASIYEAAHCLLFPALEDFGIIPLEAAARGIWVVAPHAGGTAETVKPGVNGFHFPLGQDGQMLAKVREALATPLTQEARQRMWEDVQSYSRERFQAQMKDHVLQAFHKKNM